MKGSSPKPLVHLCNGRPDNFLRVMQLLESKAMGCSHQEYQKILKFGSVLQTELKKTLKSRFTLLFPTPFHPLLHFINELSCHNSFHRLLESDIVSGEILTLVDKIIYECELDSFNMGTLIFLLLTIPNLNFASLYDKKSSKCKRWLWLKRTLRYNDNVLLRRF